MLMPFGKHKGTLLGEVPRGYLQWLHKQDFLREPLKSRVRQVLFDEPTEDERIDWVHRIVKPLDEQLAGDG